MIWIAQRLLNTARQIELPLANSAPPPRVGVNATIIVQNPPGASAAVQVPSSIVNPLATGGVVKRGVTGSSVCRFVRRTLTIAVCPTSTLPKSMSEGLAEKIGPAGGIGAWATVSENAFVAVAPVPSVTSTVKANAPAVVGLPDIVPVVASSA